MNIPNILTVGRVILAGGFIFFLTQSGLIATALATILFVVASLTDYYDGYLAKKHNKISDFGKIMDPIADKILVLAAFYIFVCMAIVPAWMFYLIMAREVMVTGSRLLAIKRGQVLAAEQAGKYKTCLQTLAIFVILIFLLLEEAGSGIGYSRDQWAQGIYFLMLLTVGLTLFSGISYFWNNRRIFLLGRMA